MKTFLRNPNRRALLTFAAATVVMIHSAAQSLPGIPEPGLTLYGDVRNTAGGNNVRLTTGTLVWTIQPAAGNPITVNTPLRNINDQFSYAVRLPFETVLPGFTLSPGALQLTTTPATYTRAATIQSVAATLVAPALPGFTFSSADRGRLERVDLQVAIVLTDTDGDGLPDNWENQHFPNVGANPEDDPDGDGMSNLREYRSGTNPNDSQSRFEVIRVIPDDANGTLVEWSSVAGKFYTVERSSDLTTGFTVVAADLSATPPLNTILDPTATGPGPWFYRIRTD